MHWSNDGIRMHLKEGIRLGAVWIILSLKISSGLLEAEVGIRFDSIRFDSIILPKCKETSTNSRKLRIGDSSRTSLTELNGLLRIVMFIFTLTNPEGSSLGRRYMLRLRSPSPLRHILCYSTPFLEVNWKPLAL